MYNERPSLRLLLALGCLGLAAWLSMVFAFPIWLGVGLSVLPIALAELGAGIADDAIRPSRVRIGAWLQSVGALAFVGVLLACIVAGRPGEDGVLWVLIPTIASGLFAATLILWDRWRLWRGQIPAMMDIGAAADRVETSGGRNLRALLTVIGGTPFLVFGIGAVFVAATLWIMATKPETHRDPGLWFALLFFGAVGLVAVATACERVASIVGGEDAHRWQRRLLLAALVMVGGGLLVIALLSHEPIWTRIGLGVFGLLLIAALPFAQRRLRRGAPLLATREGLLERHRERGVVHPWSSVLEVSLGSLAQNMTLIITLDPEALDAPYVVGEREPERAAKLLAKSERKRRQNRNFTGADLMMLATWSPEPLATIQANLCAVIESPTERDRLPPAAEILGVAAS